MNECIETANTHNERGLLDISPIWFHNIFEGGAPPARHPRGSPTNNIVRGFRQSAIGGL